jgi:hypothetical protein
MAWGVRVTGVRQLQSTLRRAGVDVGELKNANNRAAQLVAGVARPRSPRKTGRLASTVRANRATGQAVILAGNASVPYAGPIHWGWPARNIKAQPWIAAAAVSTEPRWVALYEADINRALSRVRGA